MLKKLFNKIKYRSHRRVLFASAASAVFTFALTFFIIIYLTQTGESGSYAHIARAMLTALLFAVACGVIIICCDMIIWSASLRRRANEDEISPLLNNITLDFMINFYMPVIMFDEQGTIMWYNRALDEKSYENSSLFGKNILDVCAVSAAELTADASPDGVDVSAFGTSYRVKAYEIPSPDKKYYITVWKDLSELKEAYGRLSDENTVIAYIVIDNLDELMQYVQEKYRVASAEIEQVLKGWALSADGILKEYERDKFMFIFSKQHLDKFVSDKFAILDEIRNIRVGDDNFPVTVSMGIANIDGTLEEKERAANASLDMALQRGGDQVVVKSAEGLEFYGGRTKTVQKRTKVRARVVANELVALMSKSSNVLIMGHRNADFDSIGSCAGLACLAMFCGVEYNIIVNRDDKNIAKSIEKLDSMPDFAGIMISAADAQDKITSDTLLIISDVNNPTQFESLDVAENVQKTAIIDHHRKTSEFVTPPAVSYIEPSASSSCELVSEILEQSLPAGSIPKEIADLMFAGILLDTKQFARNTGVRTFSAALYLRGEGADPADTQVFFKTKLDDIAREAKIESNTVIYRKSIAIAVNDAADNTPLDRTAAAKAADKLLNVEGVLASFALCRIDDVIHISARSNGSINVQLILEKLDGGGHYDSAATQITGKSMQKTLTRLKEAIDQYLAENR